MASSRLGGPPLAVFLAVHRAPPLKVSRLQPAHDHVILEATSQETAAPCPDYGLSSRRLHSFYSRVLRDLPWQDRPATIRVAARRFRCLNTACHRKTFTERLGAVARRLARRATRLSDLQRHVGFALGGEAAAKLATRLAIPTSADTMLRLLASVDVADSRHRRQGYPSGNGA